VGRPVTTESLQRAVPASVRRDLLAAVAVAERFPAAEGAELAEVLYGEWYLGSHVLDGRADPLDSVDLNLPDVLRAAHVDAGRWERDWTVEGVSSRGRVAVTRNGRRRVLARVDVLPVARVCLPPRPGDVVRVAVRRDDLDETGAFWFTYGGDWDESDLPVGLVRVYWHVRRRTTPDLVRVLTATLGRTDCSYALKVAVEDRQVERPDRAVLYLAGDDAAAAAPLIRRAHTELTEALLAPVPRLTLRLGRGLAMADDPGTGESFGQHRCRLVADALTAARGDGSANAEERAARALERLSAAGVDPARPYLRPGSSGGGAWPSK
jgi:HopA1 effector protein family